MELRPFLLRDFNRGVYRKSAANSFLVPQNSVSHSMNIKYGKTVGNAVVRNGTSLLGAFGGRGTARGLFEFVANNAIGSVAAVPTAGGSGYSVGDILTVTTGGTGGQVRVAKVDGSGVVLAVQVYFGGWGYTTGASKATSGGSGSSCTIQITSLGKAEMLIGAWDDLTTNPTAISLYYYDNAWHSSNTTNLVSFYKQRFAQLGGQVFRVSGGDAMTSSANGNTWGTTNCVVGVTTSLVGAVSGRLIAAGDTTYPDRVFFSSIIDPTVTPFITWNTNSTTGDWIDINPDDGGTVTAFAKTSTITLVFKNNAMYRLDAISGSTDPNLIFNIGAASQEAVTNCQGVVYFFSGQDIRRTNGGYPEQISRAGVQDFIDAIPQLNWKDVAAGTDGLNVKFSIGNVTLNTATNEQVTYINVVLEFSPRDENWSVHSYAMQYTFFAQLVTTTNATTLVGQTTGNTHTLELGTTDANGSTTLPIFYELETQELEFGNRSHLKKISDRIVVFTKNGEDGQLSYKADEDSVKPVKMTLTNRVNVGTDINIECNFLVFKWFGNSSKTPPVFEGIYLEKIDDQGIS